MATRRRTLSIAATLLLAVACGEPPRDPMGITSSFHRDGGGRTVHWFSAWTTSHGSRQTTPAMSGRTVRMILRPTISGNKLRVKLENTMGQAPVVFSGAFIGVAISAAEVVPGSNQRLTFDRQDGLTLGPGEGAYSDPVHFHVNAFERLALGLDVVSASDISTHVVGLTTNYSTTGRARRIRRGTATRPSPRSPR